MTILLPSQYMGIGQVLPSTLMDSLESVHQATMRRLFHALCPPIDAPRILDVITGSLKCISEYGSTLNCANKEFQELQSDLENLVAEIGSLELGKTNSNELDQPLFRRLTRYSAWALCISLSNTKDTKLLVLAGAELAYSLAKNKIFAKGYATNLRRMNDIRVQNDQSYTLEYLAILRRFEKTRLAAAELFETNPKSIQKLPFETRALNFLSNNQTHASPRHRQGVLDRQGQSKLQVIQSAKELRLRVENGDPEALVTILAFCSGLPVDLVQDLPFIGHASDDWIVTLESETGLIRTNISFLIPDSAIPCADKGPTRAGNKIIVRPLPAFISSLLQKSLNLNPIAKTIGELFPATSISGKTLTAADSKAAIKPSTSRFLNSAAPLAINSGIDRLAVAAITNDFSVIPESKFYYAQLDRKRIWDASETLFCVLGWGKPVAFVEGLAAGSLIIPERITILELHNWMVQQVTSLKPGKRYTDASLFKHHNDYGKYCATFAILMLASRLALQLPFTAESLDERCLFTPMFDKEVGQFQGEFPVPINKLLALLIKLWRMHCHALNKRLEKLGMPANSQLRNYLYKIERREPVKLFFQIINQRAIPLGTSDLNQWWPIHLRIKADFGRHFWECELHQAGISSTEIDMLLRHLLLGMEAHSSTSNIVLSDWLKKISRVQETCIQSLGIAPISGLTT